MAQACFIQLCVDGKEHPDRISAYVEAWHSRDQETRPLYEYLGLTAEEYNRWASNHSEIHRIVAERKQQL